MPRDSVAAPSLGLVHRDYPRGSHVVVVPATNAFADHYLHPVHRSTFEHLHRLDGAGWLQFATWHFQTGAGRTRQSHQTIFGYGINVFLNHRAAERALDDVKLPTTPHRVAHLSARRFRSSDVAGTLVFVFFVYKAIEVEAYYEYDGVAPMALSRELRHTFSTQTSHLAHLARKLVAAPQRTATPLPTDSDIPTATATSTATPLPAPSATSTATPIPTAAAQPTATRVPTATRTPTPVPSPTPTATPLVVYVAAAMDAPHYAPGSRATVTVTVTSGGKGVPGVVVHATFTYPNTTTGCDATTDDSGRASCSTIVPSAPDGAQVQVVVEAIYGAGQTASATTAFYVHT